MGIVIIPSLNQTQLMANKNTEKVRVILERMKEDETYGSYFSLVLLKYNREDFIKKNKSVSQWFKKLTNGKTKTGGVYNRDWFRKIDNGFYKKYINGNEIEIWLAFEGQSKLNKTDLTTRILKLQPKPEYYEIGIQDWDMLKNHFSDLFETDSGIEVFGNIKKEDITIFTSIINPNN